MTPVLIDTLKHLVTERLDVKLGVVDIDETTPLFAGGMELDSIAVVELITHIEKQFGFDFTDDDLRPENFVNLRTIAALVEQRLASAPQRHATA
jgi:acyl carrier protein